MDDYLTTYPMDGYMKKLKLDFEGFSLEELRTYQEVFVSTISKLKGGLFNADAALGLHNSLSILSDLHLQTSSHLRECQDKIDELGITTEFTTDEV